MGSPVLLLAEDPKKKGEEKEKKKENRGTPMIENYQPCNT